MTSDEINAIRAKYNYNPANLVTGNEVKSASAWTPEELAQLDGSQTPQTAQTSNTSIPLDVGIGAAKGFGSTAVNTASLIGAGLQKIGVPEGTFFTPTRTDIEKAKAKLEAKNTAQKVGKTVEQTAEYFIPGGAGLKATKGAGLLTKVTTQAAAGGLVGAAQSGDLGTGVETGVISGAFPVAGKTLKFITTGVTKNVAGSLAKGTAILDNVLENPQAALEGLNKPAGEVFAKDIGLIKKAVTNTYTQAKNAYGQGIKRLDVAIPQVDPSKATPYISESLNKFGVKLQGNPSTGFIVDVTESPLSDTEKTIVQRAIDLVSKSPARTPSEVDALAQKIGKFEKAGADAAQVNSIINGIKNGVRRSIVESAPPQVKDIAENITTNYAKSMDKLNLYQQLFRVSKDKMFSEVEKANATNKLKNLLSGDKTVEHQTLRDLGLEDIISRQAGRVTAAEDISRAQTGLGDILKTAVNTVATPQTITRVAAYTKLGSDKVLELLNKSKTVGDFVSFLPKGVQAYVLQELSSGK